MYSMDPYKEETSSILEVASSKLSKSTNNSDSSNELMYLPIHNVIINILDKYLRAIGFHNVVIT